MLISKIEIARLKKKNKAAAQKRAREMKISALDSIVSARHDVRRTVISEGDSVSYNRKAAKRSLRREEW